MTTYTWRWSWEFPGDTCPTAVEGRVYASREEAEDAIREVRDYYDHNVVRHEGPDGEPTSRKVYRVSPLPRGKGGK